MSTGTIIMIVCAVLYGLIVILFKDGNEHTKKEGTSFAEKITHDPWTCTDGTMGINGLFADDFDNNPLK